MCHQVFAKSIRLAAICLMVVGCGGKAEPEPSQTADAEKAVRRVAEQYLQFAAAADERRALSLLTEAARKNVVPGSGRQSDAEQVFQLDFSEGFRSGEVAEIRINGDAAVAVITRAAENDGDDAWPPGELMLKREEGAWKIYGFSSPFVPGGKPVMVNFEQPEDFRRISDTIGEAFAENFQGGMDSAADDLRHQELEELRQVAALESLSTQEFEDAWQIDVQEDGRAAREILVELLQPVGWLIEDSAATKAALDRRISLSLSGVSRFEAVEQVCRAVDITPKYPNPMAWDGGALAAGLVSAARAMADAVGDELPEEYASAASRQNVVTFEPGARSAPIAYAGPFLIQLSELEEQPPTATGRIDILAWATDLPTSILTTNKGRRALSIDRVQSPSGESVLVENQGMEMGEFPMVQATLSLRNLLRAVTAITVAGTAEIRVPTGVETMHFEDLQPAATRSAGEVVVTLAQVEQGSSQQFALSGSEEVEGVRMGIRYTKPSHTDLHFVAFDQRGNVLPLDQLHSFHVGNEGEAHLFIEGEPVQMMAKAVVAMETLEYPFTLEELPLERASKQPEKLPPLEFSGHAAPVSVEVLEISGEEAFRKVQLRAANHSNKDVRRIGYTLHYLDASGNELEDHSSGHSGFPNDPLVRSRAQNEFDVTAFFMPQEAQEVKVTLEEVRFTDWTGWARQSDKP